ncbi:hypothetical protein GmRootV116_44720 [Variovorax sp. V116]
MFGAPSVLSACDVFCDKTHETGSDYAERVREDARYKFTDPTCSRDRRPNVINTAYISLRDVWVQYDEWSPAALRDAFAHSQRDPTSADDDDRVSGDTTNWLPEPVADVA